MAKIKWDSKVKYAVRGRVVTLDANSSVIDDGIIYIEGDKIIEIKTADEDAPAGWLKSTAIKSSGSIYPGMIELHNHLAYNIIPAWDVPKTFLNRDQWRRHDDYTKKMTGPLRILGSMDGYLQAIVRYTECKLLFSGVTSSQGITLAAAPTVRSLFKGMVRNVEATMEKDILPPAKTKIADIKKASDLMSQLDKKNTYILHLAEGVPESANKHFKALKFENSNKWAINEYLAGIHAVGLFPDDYKVFKRHNGNIVWSPLSNLLLYGKTTDIDLVKQEGIAMSIGSDWSPSGSKNLLNEIKVAKLICEAKNNIYSSEDIVRMVTTEPAKILKWSDHIGSLEAGKKADLIVINGRTDDPYDQFIACREKSINWVIIGGIPRFGIPRLMEKFSGKQELIRINKMKRKLNLDISDQVNAIDLDINYKNAKTKLASGLRRLPALAVQYENAANNGFAMGAAGNAQMNEAVGKKWIIEHDHRDIDGSCSRHHIPFGDEETTTEIHNAQYDQAAAPLSERVEKMLLDESTVEDDKLYFKRLAGQLNLDEYLKLGLPLYYNRKVDLDSASNYKLEISRKEQESFNRVLPLKTFLSAPGYLSLNEKVQIIDQANVILEQAYVHLQQKNAMYAVNPQDRLRVLKAELLAGEEALSELNFHRRMIEIFTSLRDLHTLYQLPEPYASKLAYLPFFVEQYYDKGERRFVVSKLIGRDSFGQFKEGVIVTHWNGMPIEEAILMNGQSYAGSNEAARFARGLDSLCFRPLSVMLPPRSEWVGVTFKTSAGKTITKRFQWKVGSHFDLERMKKRSANSEVELALAEGFDYITKTVQDTKKDFFAKGVSDKPKKINRRALLLAGKDYYHTNMPFKAKRIKHGNRAIGYIRVFTFSHSDHKAMAMEFKRLINEMACKNLIIDIRNNPGGNIYASEFMLQALSKKKIQPQPAQFLNSKLSQFICDKYSYGDFPELNLKEWNNTLKSIKSTGAKFSAAYAISPKTEMQKYAANEDYNCVLITDALCYSASDIFASGFKDYKIGKILGIDKNTGAGGANVWSLSTIYHLSKNSEGTSDFLDVLPYGADIRVAVRRMIRTGDSKGVPLEDLGVRPDEIHEMTKNDLMNDNEDLIAKAVSMLV